MENDLSLQLVTKHSKKSNSQIDGFFEVYLENLFKLYVSTRTKTNIYLAIDKPEICRGI